MTKSNLKNIINLLKYLKPYWKKEVSFCLLSLIIGLLSLVNPYLTKLIIDDAYALKDLSFFIKILILAGLIFIISNLLSSWTQYLNLYVSTRVRFDFQKKVFRDIENLPYSFFQEKPTGEYMYKLIEDSSRVTAFLTGVLPELIYTIPKFLLIIVILLMMNLKITFFLFALLSLLYIPIFLLIRRIRKESEKLSESSQDILEVVREIFSHMQLVKIFAKEKAELKRYVRHSIANIRTEIAGAKLDLLYSFLDSGINRLLFGLITFYGGYNIIKGQMSLGSFTAIIIYISQLFGLQGYIASLFMRFNIGNISIQRLSTILESHPPEADDKKAKAFYFPSGQIEFRKVSFAYYPEQKVIHQLNFKIGAHWLIGLVGQSGRGKTTLINLIVKLYPLQQGEILIDNQDINLIKNSYLREQIGVALQKPLLWNDTIKNNIIYSCPKATNEEILRVAEISGANDFIKNLPKKFDTKVGEEGIWLSEGQKQRLALARAVIKNPKILIIDEGMSSLDSQTEDRIISNLKQEFKQTTIIVVSHRLSTIKKMDLVYFLEGADKITIGQHEQLVKENIGYRELFASQLEEEKESVSV